MKTNRRGRVGDRLTACFKVLFFAVFGALFINMCFFSLSTYPIQIGKQLVMALCILFVMTAILFLVSRCMASAPKLKMWFKHHFALSVWIGFSILMVIHLYMAYQLYVPITWDVGFIVNAATAEDLSSIGWYFAFFPYNLSIFAIIRIFLGIVGYTPGNLWFILSSLNVVAIDSALLFTVLMARRAQGVRCGYITLFFLFIQFIMFPWLIVPYSDTLSMPFVTGVLYCFTLLRNTEHSKSRVWIAIAMGLFLAIGTSIKYTVVIALVALIIPYCSQISKDKAQRFKTGRLLIVSIVTYTGLFFVFSLILQTPIKKNQAFPLSHMFAMGLSENNGMYGAYNEEDVLFTVEQGTTDQMDIANKKKIKERLSAMGLSGYADFLSKKARWITSEGYFFWGYEGDLPVFLSINQTC